VVRGGLVRLAGAAVGVDDDEEGEGGILLDSVRVSKCSMGSVVFGLWSV
jgi:hypothetical protein